MNELLLDARDTGKFTSMGERVFGRKMKEVARTDDSKQFSVKLE
jgi:hypothetical protein